MASALHIQQGGGSRAACLFVACAGFLHSCPCLLICSRDVLRPHRGLLGHRIPPSSPSPELLLEQDEQREEGRSQQVRDCRSMLAWWLGNQLNPLRICSPWRHYSVPGGAGPYYRGHAGCPPLAISQQLCCCTPTVPGSQPPPRHGSCPTEQQKHRGPTPCAFNP